MAMGNIIKFLRFAISNLPHNITEADAKEGLVHILKSFLDQRILFARESISNVCQSVIRENDVILTFGSSPVIRQILQKTAAIKHFRLIVVDCMPLREGVKTLSVMSSLVRCTYVPLSGAASAIREATKVILGMLVVLLWTIFHSHVGASALLSNGSVLAPAGNKFP